MQHFLQAIWNCNFEGATSGEDETDVWYLDNVIECIQDYDGMTWTQCPKPTGFTTTNLAGDGPTCWEWDDQACTWGWNIERDDCSPAEKSQYPAMVSHYVEDEWIYCLWNDPPSAIPCA